MALDEGKISDMRVLEHDKLSSKTSSLDLGVV